MKRAIGYVMFGVLIVGAVYYAVNRLSPFTAADEEGTPVVEALASPTMILHPTIAPSATFQPSPIPPTIAPTSAPMVVPTEIPVMPTLVPTSTPAMEVIVPAEIPATEIVAAEALATELILPTEIPVTVVTTVSEPVSSETLVAEATTTPETVPSEPPVDAGIVPTSTPDVIRQGEGGLTSPSTGGQLSVSTPVVQPQPPALLPTATLPGVEPTALPIDIQPTLVITLPPTLLVTPVPALAQLSGTVTAPLSVILVLTYPDGTTISGLTAEDGSFLFANLQPGTYRLEASADGFLTSQIELTLEGGETLTLPPAVLRGGDTNRDNVVDVRDAVLIAANFGGAPASPEIDLNRDGAIDIRDLTILGAMFGESGPTAWG